MDHTVFIIKKIGSRWKFISDHKSQGLRVTSQYFTKSDALDAYEAHAKHWPHHNVIVYKGNGQQDWETRYDADGKYIKTADWV